MKKFRVTFIDAGNCPIDEEPMEFEDVGFNDALRRLCTWPVPFETVKIELTATT